MKIGPGLTDPSTTLARFGVHQIVDPSVPAVLRGNHRDGKFPLRAIASFHDLADAQSTMLSRDVRLMAICRGLDRCKSWRRLIL